MLKLAQKIAFLTVAALIMPAVLWADSMSSTNYKVTSDDLSAGGSFSSSANYRLSDTLSEVASPTGEGLSSANYRTCVGFQCTGGAASLTVNFATSATPCTSSTTGTPPFSVGLGTLTTGAVSTASNHVCIRVSSDGSNTIVVTVSDAHGGLASTSVPADIIASESTTLVSGAQGYGICSTATANGFTAASPYNGSCDATNHAVGALTTGFQTIYSASGVITDAYGDVLIKASASSATKAHSDYSDTLTFVATGTF